MIFVVTGIKKEEVAEVYMGHGVQGGVGQNPARQAVLFAGQYMLYSLA